MRGMLLAAGLGTRLRPLTDRLPKPVVPVLGRPLGAYALERLAAAGVTEVAVNLHPQAETVLRLLRQAAPAGVTLHPVVEHTLLGTGGGVRAAVAAMDEALGGGDAEEVLVLNADVLFWPQLEAAVATHRATGALATMIVRDDPVADGFGRVRADGDGRLRQLLGEPAEAPASLTPYAFTGVHVLGREALRELPEEGCIVRRSYRRWVDAGAPVQLAVDPNPWLDLGNPEGYRAACVALATGGFAWPSVTPDPEQGWIHPEASVHPEAEVRRSVIEAGARVEAGAEVEQSVLWPGAVVRGVLRGQVQHT